MSKFEQLKRVIVENSVSNQWNKAVMEWEVHDCVEDSSCEESCVCGQQHLVYLFTIRNVHNDRFLKPIGSVCIGKFGREDLTDETRISEQLFRLLHAIEKGKFVALNSELFSRKLLKHLYDVGAFQTTKYGNARSSYEFMLQMFNQRTPPTPNQQKKINALIIFDILPYLKGILAEKVIRENMS